MAGQLAELYRLGLKDRARLEEQCEVLLEQNRHLRIELMQVRGELRALRGPRGIDEGAEA